jgi:hypothetical protein
MPPIIRHIDIPIPSLWWLPVFVVLSTWAAHFVLSDDGRVVATGGRRFWMAAMIGLAASVTYWWVAQYGLDNIIADRDVQYRWGGHGPTYYPGLIVAGLACWGVSWVFTAFALERQPELQGDRYYDLVSKASGFAAAAIVVTNIVRVLMAT